MLRKKGKELIQNAELKVTKTNVDELLKELNRDFSFTQIRTRIMYERLIYKI